MKNCPNLGQKFRHSCLLCLGDTINTSWTSAEIESVAKDTVVKPKDENKDE